MPPLARHRLALILLIPFGGANSPVSAVSGPWIEQGPARLRLISRWAAVPVGSDAGIGLEFQLAPGWHIYWRNAGDAGYPPELEFEPGALVEPRLLFPAPHRFDLPGDLVAFGYDSQVIYPVEARVAETGSGLSTLAPPLAANVNYLVCAMTCVPYESSLALSLPVGLDAREDPELSARLDSWRARVPTPAPAAIEGQLVQRNGPGLTLELRFPDWARRAIDPDLFFDSHPLLALARPTRFERAAGPGFRIDLRQVDETKPLPERLHFSWTLVGSDRGDSQVAWQGEIAVDRPRAAVSRAAGITLGLVTVIAALLWIARRAQPVLRH